MHKEVDISLGYSIGRASGWLCFSVEILKKKYVFHFFVRKSHSQWGYSYDANNRMSRFGIGRLFLFVKATFEEFDCGY